MKFSIKDFFSKFDQIRSFSRIWSHLLKKLLMENFIFMQWLLIVTMTESFISFDYGYFKQYDVIQLSSDTRTHFC